MKQIEFVNEIKTKTGYRDTRWLELEIDDDGDLTIEASSRNGNSVILLLSKDDAKKLADWLVSEQ